MVWVTGSMVMQMLGCGGGGHRWCSVMMGWLADGVVCGWMGSQVVWCWGGWGHRWCGWVGLQVVWCGLGWGPGWCRGDKNGVLLPAEGKQLFIKSPQFSFLGIS